MTKIIAELGINHDGCYKKCKELINIAHRCGAWGVKFQYRNIKNYISKGLGNEIGKKIIDQELQRVNLEKKEIIRLVKYAKSKKLKVGISFFDVQDTVDFKYSSFDFYKIPSAVNDDLNLIQHLKNKKKLTLISLGGKSGQEVIQLSKIYKKIFKNKRELCVLHCISNYPLNDNNNQLFYLEKLKKIFKNFNIGYSSHENDILGPVLSLSKNINFIERHITLKKNSLGLDHSSSSDEVEFKRLCEFANSIEISKKIFSRVVNQGEKINIQNLGKSFVSKINQKRGNIIKLKNFDYRYPRNGLSYLELMKYENNRLERDIKKNEFISCSHIKKSKSLSNKELRVCSKKKISLPVRPSDFVNIDKKFNLDNYEFHLSFSDLSLINKFLNKDCVKDRIKCKNFTVHLPDYCSEKYVLNIFSKNKLIRSKSNKILKTTISFCKKIQNMTNKKTVLVGSFSSLEKVDKEKYYKKIKDLIFKIYRKHNILISPQWLPPFAWYFGGSMKMYSFCDPGDLKYIKKFKFHICLDVSHFILSCNFYNIKNSRTLVKKYKNLFNHYHLADAKGFDFEGLHFFEGDLMNTGILEEIMNSNKKKVLEPWQGHIDNYQVFVDQIKKITKF